MMNMGVKGKGNNKVIDKYIKENNLSFEKIIRYARESKNKKILDILFEIAE